MQRLRIFRETSPTTSVLFFSSFKNKKKYLVYYYYYILLYTMEGIAIREDTKKNMEETDTACSARQFDQFAADSSTLPTTSVGDRPISMRAGYQTRQSIVAESSVCRGGFQERSKYTEEIY